MPFDQQRYEQLHADLVDRNGVSIDNVYLDVLGIPNGGLVVALTALEADRTMALNANHVTALADAANFDAYKLPVTLVPDEPDRCPFRSVMFATGCVSSSNVGGGRPP